MISSKYDFSDNTNPESINVVDIYAKVGAHLNEQYLKNRQSYVSGIIDPLSKMKVRKEDEGTFNQIKDSITNRFDQNVIENDWSQATGMLFDAQADLMNNNGLKAVQEAFIAEQNYLANLNESKWSTEDKLSFRRQSELQSKAIEYDSDTNSVLSGGFNGVQFGEPYDVAELQDRILQHINAIEASGSSIEEVLANPTSVGANQIASLIGADGNTIYSHIVERTKANEGVSKNRIQNITTALMELNPEYKSYLSTVKRNSLINNRYAIDENGNGYLKDFDNTAMYELYEGSELEASLQGLGLQLANLGSQKSDGSFEMTDDNEAYVVSELAKLGFDGANIVELLKIPSDRRGVTANDPFVASGLNMLNAIYKDQYADNLEAQGGDINSIDWNNWTERILVDNFVNSSISKQSDYYGNTYAYNKHKTSYDINSNAYFNKAYESREEQIEAMYNDILSTPIDQTPIYHSMQASLENVEVEVDKINTNLKHINMPDSKQFPQLYTNGMLDEDKILTFDTSKLPEDMTTASIRAYQSGLRAKELVMSDHINSYVSDMDIKQILSETGDKYIQNDVSFNLGKISPYEKLMLETDSFDEYVERFNKAFDKKDLFSTGIKGVIPSFSNDDYEIHKERAKVKLIKNLYKDQDYRGNFNTVKHINMIDGSMGRAMIAQFENVATVNPNSVIVTATPTGKGVGQTLDSKDNKNLQRLLKLKGGDMSQTFRTGDISTTYRMDGTALTTEDVGISNKKNAKPIYRTEIKTISNGLNINHDKNTAKQSYAVLCYGANNEPLGQVEFTQDASPAAVTALRYNTTMDAMQAFMNSAGTPRESILKGEAGRQIGAYNDYAIYGTSDGSNNSIGASNLAELSQKLYTASGVTTTDINYVQPGTNGVNENLSAKLQFVPMASKDGTKKVKVNVLGVNDRMLGDKSVWSIVDGVEIPITELPSIFVPITTNYFQSEMKIY